jgi:endonuclease YncB( thermonuclease family)
MARISPRKVHQVLRGQNPKTVVILLALLGVLYLIDRQQPDPAAAARGRYEGRCVNVIDGDTLDVRTDSGESFRLRLLGVDCMDTHQEAKVEEQARRLRRSAAEVVRLGERATARTRGLVQGKPIAWEVPEGTPLFDPYDRMLAYVELPGGGEDLGERLLREGLAELRRDRHPRTERYRAAAAPLAW